MSIWSETRFQCKTQGFEDGLNDARRNTVNPIAYQIYVEYRKGVDIARQLTAVLEAAQREIQKRPVNRTDLTAHLSPQESALGFV